MHLECATHKASGGEDSTALHLPAAAVKGSLAIVCAELAESVLPLCVTFKHSL